jgi:hypothetical protein
MLSQMLNALLLPKQPVTPPPPTVAYRPTASKAGWAGYQANAPAPQPTYDPLLDPIFTAEVTGLTGVTPVASVSNPFAAAIAGNGMGVGGGPLISKALPKDFGRNKPLDKPAFFGYHGDKPLYAGGKLYISC